MQPRVSKYASTKGDMVDSVIDYTKIVHEIEQVGWDKLFHVNHDFSEMKLKMIDSSKCEHILSVKLTNTIPEVSAEYPRNVVCEWAKVYS